MSNLLNDLKKLVSAKLDPIYTGAILSVSGTTAVVSTRSGSVKLPIAGSATYNVGDEVRVSNNTIVGKASSVTDLPHYFV